MVEVDQIISVVPKHGFNVPGTRDPSRALYEKTINFVVSMIQLKNFVEEISWKDTRTSLAWINAYKFILKQLAIQKVAQITHH